VKRNSIVGKELHLYEGQLNGKFKRRLCSAKPPYSGKTNSWANPEALSLNFEEKNYIVNDTEYDNMQLIVARTPKSTTKYIEFNPDLPRDVENIKTQKEDFLYKIKLPEGINQTIR